MLKSRCDELAFRLLRSNRFFLIFIAIGYARYAALSSWFLSNVRRAF